MGAVGKAGSDSYNPANSQYTINGAGAGVTGTAERAPLPLRLAVGNLAWQR